MKTIENSSEGEYYDKNSKFYSFLLPISSEMEAQELMKAKRDEHPKANHLCYAYRLQKADQLIENLSDDGEPVNSAGQPILRQLKGEELVNVLAMVVRYFGGVKLGVGGLMKAYKAATKEAIKHSRIKEIKEMAIIEVKVDYSKWGELMALLDKENLNFEMENGQDQSKIKIAIFKEEEDRIVELLSAHQFEIT